MAPRNTNAALVTAVIAGDPRAQERFLRDWGPKVLGWCARLGGAGIDPEDAAHDVFERVFSRLHTLRDPTLLSSWLYKITRRTVKDHRRRAWLRRWVPGQDVDTTASREPGPALRLVASRRAQQVQDVLERLHAGHREVLVLCEMEERSGPEVAELLGVPLGTVKSRLHRARAAFEREARKVGLRAETALDSMEELG